MLKNQSVKIIKGSLEKSNKPKSMEASNNAIRKISNYY